MVARANFQQCQEEVTPELTAMTSKRSKALVEIKCTREAEESEVLVDLVLPRSGPGTAGTRF